MKKEFGLAIVNQHLALAAHSISKEFYEMQKTIKEEYQQVFDEAKKYDKDNPIFCSLGLFETMDMGRLEVAHTKALGWLINPKSIHGFGAYCIEGIFEFLKNDNKIHKDFVFVPDEDETNVYCERTTSCKSRVDIWADMVCKETGGRRLLVIEAKIDHEETNGQLAKYDKEISAWEKKHGGFVTRLYLTIDKRVQLSSRSEWIEISYEDLFLALWKNANVLKEKDGYQFLRLYLAGILKDLHGWELPLGLDSTCCYTATTLLRKLVEK